MRKLITATLAIALTIGPNLNANAEAKQRTGPCTGSRGFVTREMPLEEQRQKVRWLIACAALQWPVDLSTAFYIAERESHFWPYAKNPSSSASGVFQFISGTWDGLVDAWPRMNHWTGTWVFSARANVLRAIRCASESGWSPWS